MFEFLVPENIATLTAYPPGKPLEELEREFGVTGAIKLASNENPLGPSPLALKAIQSQLATLNRYPDSGAYYLKQRLSRHLGISPEQLILGNGSDEILELIIRTFLQPGEEVLSFTPSFLMYGLLTQGAGGIFRPLPLKDFRVDLEALIHALTPHSKIVIINNPNNPTGTAIYRTEWENFLKALPSGVIVVLDEAYIDFVESPDVASGLDYLDEQLPLIGLRTFSKAYGLAGLRVGYGYGPSELIDYLNRMRQPFNVNSLAQVAARSALDDQDFLDRTRQLVREGLAFLCQELDRLGVEYIPTQANFLLIRVNRDGQELYQLMLREGVIIRAMSSYNLPEWIRVNAGRPEENLRFLQAFKKVMGFTA
ncbi:MAG: histidinol-phosphate transaminase [Deltaproteobacteria bacterium]|nr:histidinol-phosphate transaminase [Deltaproteobacteria bacterium]MBW1952613.1 histidinol-phosphate transaminase [Deltaproteobacteria bacterium]MBW1986260.1 histidinol-phosphate transaminase [Deltaproteobacteria bacterium]MBW2134157.1 histidinol-phosphate transaminase [Deltaproteobacteria bacterium]